MVPNQAFHRLKGKSTVVLLFSEPHNYSRSLGVYVSHKLDLLAALNQIGLVDANRIDPTGQLAWCSYVSKGGFQIRSHPDFYTIEEDWSGNCRVAPCVGQRAIVRRATQGYLVGRAPDRQRWHNGDNADFAIFVR